MANVIKITPGQVAADGVTIFDTILGGSGGYGPGDLVTGVDIRVDGDPVEIASSKVAAGGLQVILKDAVGAGSIVHMDLAATSNLTDSSGNSVAATQTNLPITNHSSKPTKPSAVRPLDDVATATYDFQESKHRHDAQDSVEILKEISRSWRYDAKIATVSSEHSDEYTVDFYEKGFFKQDGSNADPTRFGIIAHSVYVQESYDVGCVVQVKLLSDNTALILPPTLPTGSGFGKVLMILSNSSAQATGIYEYPRFALR